VLTSVYSSNQTVLDALENGADSDTMEKSNRDQPEKEEPQLAAIAKDLKRIKRQNTITHALLGTVILMTAVCLEGERGVCPSSCGCRGS
jgi:hypothetical protein